MSTRGPLAKYCVISVLLGVLAACATQTAVDPKVQEFSHVAHEVAREPLGSIARSNTAWHQRNLAREIMTDGHSDQISEATIDDLITATTNQNTALSACGALIELGPRARRGAPAIQVVITGMENRGDGEIHIRRMRNCYNAIIGVD